MSIKEEFKVKGGELLSFIKDLIKEGNVRRIVVKDDKNKKYIDIPVTVGIAGVVLAPFLAAIAAVAVFTTTLTVEVIRDED
ncbi:MAG: DUF4342 domain-containing protein [Bacteroidetes bacterium]|nr:DUF4342 domain-containing protein [Bacteroidota bacterium]